MKMIQKMRFAAVMAGVLLLGATYATPARAAVIRVAPPLQTVALSDGTAAVDIMLDLAVGESTGGYTFGLLFDSTILSPNLVGVNAAPFDNGFDPAPLFSATPTLGRLDFFMLSFAGLIDPLGHPLPAQGSGFLLAHVVFSTLQQGTSFVTPTLIPGGLVSNADGSALLPTTLEGGCITVARSITEPSVDCRQTPVPEPGTLSLIGLGVAGLAAAARRRARA